MKKGLCEEDTHTPTQRNDGQGWEVKSRSHPVPERPHDTVFRHVNGGAFLMWFGFVNLRGLIWGPKDNVEGDTGISKSKILC